MKTPEQNISTGFHRRGLSLSYIFAVAMEGGADPAARRRMFEAIQTECEQLGIEPMDTTTFETWEGRAPGHED
jgi:hypothetical protein